MPADLEVGVELVPDESALEDIQQQQLEITGDGGAVEEAREMNEEQTDLLQTVSRRLGRIVTKLGALSLIVATLGVLAKTIGSVFDIGFEDVRNGIVSALNVLKDTILQVLGFSGGGAGSASGASAARTGIVQGFTGLGGLTGLAPLVDTLAEAQQGGGSGSSSSSDGFNFSLFTSRDQLSGDSTQKEQDTQNFEFFKFEGGS